jgi:hypothetical protein
MQIKVCPLLKISNQTQYTHYTVEGVDFWNLWIFDLLQLNLDWQKNSKAKLGKAYFCIFMSSYAEMSFFTQKC